MKLCLDGRVFRTATHLHQALQTLLGFPSWYGQNWDALLDCFSSLDDEANGLCAVLANERVSRVTLRITSFSLDDADPVVLGEFIHAVATANARLAARSAPGRIRLEFEASLDEPLAP